MWVRLARTCVINSDFLLICRAESEGGDGLHRKLGVRLWVAFSSFVLCTSQPLCWPPVYFFCRGRWILYRDTMDFFNQLLFPRVWGGCFLGSIKVIRDYANAIFLSSAFSWASFSAPESTGDSSQTLFLLFHLRRGIIQSAIVPFPLRKDELSTKG